MKILVIGGTAFIGPYVVRQLVEQGHSVTLFHRGKTEADLPPGVSHVYGDQDRLAEHQAEIRTLAPDVVIAMALFTRATAASVCQAVSGLTPRLIVPSSIDVYRAYGRLCKTEPGPPDPIPLTEDSSLRQKLSVHGEAYDKTAVEEIVMNQDGFQASVLRLPMVYGPLDYQHRLYEHLKRMDDGRKVILLPEEVAGFRASRGYVENVAAAITLAATNERASGHIYNVGEEAAFTEQEWVEIIGREVGWQGRIVTAPLKSFPSEKQTDLDFNQHFVVDTAKIREQLGYSEPVPFDQGLQKTIAWERANPPANIKPEDFDYAEEDRISQTAGLA